MPLLRFGLILPMSIPDVGSSKDDITYFQWSSITKDLVLQWLDSIWYAALFLDQTRTPSFSASIQGDRVEDGQQLSISVFVRLLER